MNRIHKNMLTLLAVLLCLPAWVFAQNSPIGAANAPLIPTEGMITLPAAYSAGVNLNFKRSFIPFRKVTNAADPMFTLAPTGDLNFMCKVTTAYFNGFGDGIQSISRAGNVYGSMGNKDIVALNDLRSSLVDNTFIPYPVNASSQFRYSGFGEQLNHFMAKYPEENKRSYAQTRTSYPAGVPSVESFSPGSSFVGCKYGAKVETGVNDGSENIIIYSYFSSSGGLVQNVGYYPAGELIKKTTEIVGSAPVEEYIDKDGRLICKKVITGSPTTDQISYYVYNELGMLINILTPLGSRRLDITGEPFVQAHDLTSSFAYNEYGNLVEKSVPGEADANAVVYDAQQRPVLTQTPLLKSQGLFHFNLYDSRGRVVISGLVSDNRNFVVIQHEINGAAYTPLPGTLGYYIVNEVNGPYPVSIADCEIDIYNYYDTYQIPSAFNTTYETELGVAAMYAGDYHAYMVTNGLLTGSITRIKDEAFPCSSDKWTFSVVYYDKFGHVIQVQSTNPQAPEPLANCQAGTSTIARDIAHVHYDFAGNKVLDILEHHEPSGVTPAFTKIYTKYIYDYANGARLRTVVQSINNGMFIPISKYTYNDLGQVSQKSLGNGLEVQNYDYNIRGQLAGINRDYVNSQCSPEGVAATFGCTLSYDYGFNTPRYDGSVSGIKWRGASRVTPLRSYGYHYDRLGQLVHAEFREFSDNYGFQPACGLSPGTYSWNKVRTDFTVSNINYDQNGNILKMDQRGNSAAGPVDMDLMTYAYKPWTNQLDHVTDAGVAEPSLPDFKDIGDCSSSSIGSAACTDYESDEDGNLRRDQNKKITVINYNENDQPILVKFENGSGIANTYTAAGSLITKVVSDPSSGGDPVTYTYYGPFTYKDGVLQFVLHDEGRAKFSNTDGLFTYDYFVKDHLGNVRTVVSNNMKNTVPDVIHEDEDGSTAVPAPGGRLRSYVAGHEPDDAKAENQVFSNIDAVRDVKPATQNQADGYSARLNADKPERVIGTAIMLKVMAGDTVDANVEGYYDDTTAATAPNLPAADILASLLSTMNGGGGLLNQNMPEQGQQPGGQGLQDMNGNVDYKGYKDLIDNQYDPEAPMAFLNYLFFDEDMVFRPELSGAIQVAKVAGQWQAISTKRIRIEVNGYVNIFLSNGTSKDVHFDWFHVNVYHGNLLQESHYYPFGLTLNMGESLGGVKNKFKYQGKELQEELGFGLYDFTARQYDPQIGRFWGIDPAGQFANGYNGMGNDPANMIDPTGCWSTSTSGVIDPNANGTKIKSSSAGWSQEDTYLKGDAYSNGDNEAFFENVRIDEKAEDEQLRLEQIAKEEREKAEREKASMPKNTEGWKPLGKAQLLDYVIRKYFTELRGASSGRINNYLGKEFEDMYAEYLDREYFYYLFKCVFYRTNNKQTVSGPLGNVAPDFLRIFNSSSQSESEIDIYIELKQTRNNINLSSFQGQIRAMIAAARSNDVPSVWIVTTWGVRLGDGVKNFAKSQGINLVHYWAEFKMENGKMITNYVKN